MSCKYVIFDFDGTIADSSEGVRDSLIYAYNAFSLPLPDEETIRKFFGPPLTASFMKYAGVDEETGAAMTAKYRELYTDNAMYRLKLYDGMKELLENLSNDNIKIAIASSKPKKFFDKLLNRLEIAQYFNAVSGAAMDAKDDSKREIILQSLDSLGVENKNEALMVGDRKFDILGAKGAGIRSVGVTYGFGSREEFEKAGADFIVDTPNEIYEIVKKLNSHCILDK
ncbi:MAG: HAD-IA family hydrolase [Clostridia bacterium]|nr:HAD-IA family hydrolase [Clostridia bacterium]